MHLFWEDISWYCLFTKPIKELLRRHNCTHSLSIISHRLLAVARDRWGCNPAQSNFTHTAIARKISRCVEKRLPPIAHPVHTLTQNCSKLQRSSRKYPALPGGKRYFKTCFFFKKNRTYTSSNTNLLWKPGVPFVCPCIRQQNYKIVGLKCFQKLLIPSL